MEFISDILSDHPLQRSNIGHALSSLRKHLGMAVAYVSEFQENELVFRDVDAPGLEALIKPGDRRSLDDAYCRHILEGRLPELIPDTGLNAFAQTLSVTHEVRIGAHMSVPVRLQDGSVYGMFCCLNFAADPSLNERDLKMMRVFADLTARQLDEEAATKRSADEKRARVAEVLSERAFRIVFQPIWDFAEDRPLGFEALCRFNAEPYRTPDMWFAESEEVGLGLEMELAAIEAALDAGAALPPHCYLSVNASPDLILSGRLGGTLERHAGRRVVIEVTEHAAVSDYPALLAQCARLRKAGARIAVDDAGAGYAGLQHILQLRPDMIKLDIARVRAIDTDMARRSLVSALMFFAQETGCLMVAEGIETQAELDSLRQVGVHCGQGYLFSRPLPIEAALALLTAPARLRLAG
ncbi:MAG: EAL domain-containing protein [Pseudomonadota bacterium]